MRDADSGGRSDGSDVGAKPETDEEKAKQREARLKKIERALATAGFLDPGTSDAGPTGTVTLGAKSGSLAPWVAHDVLGTAAADVAAAAKDNATGARVLVTDDPALLRSDLLSHIVHETLAHRVASLDVKDRVQAAIKAVIPPEESTRSAAPEGGQDDADDDTGAEEEGAGAEAGAAAASSEESASSPIVAAANLIKLAAVDFTITTAEVTADSGLLARLVAGNLARELGSNAATKVVLDGFGPADPAGRTLTQLHALVERLREARDELTRLRARTGPLSARIATLKLDVERAHEALSDAGAAKDATKDGVAALKADLDELRASLAADEKVLAPAQVVVDHVAAEIAGAEADLKALLAPDDAGTSPLLRACSREGLHRDEADTENKEPITRVLHAGISHLGADTVTRRSVLGSSGRVGFLGAATVSWTLLAATERTVIDGGSRPVAAAMTYDLESTKSSWSSIDGKASTLGDDPLRQLEDRMRTGVLVMAAALMILSVAAVIASVAAFR